MSIDTEAPVGSQHELIETDVEREVARSLRQLLGREATWQDVLARTESDEPVDRALWKRIAVDQGLAGLAVPESLGGAGASWREVGVVMEELGRACAPVPYLGSAVLSTALLLQIGADELVGQLASGERTAALAVRLTCSPATPGSLPVSVADDRLSGAVPVVADALAADVLIVPTADGVYAVEAGDAVITPAVSLDMTRPLADVRLDGAPGVRLSSGDPSDALGAALTIGAAMLASEQAGVAAQSLETALAYLKQRYQFGRLIGSYQALKHRMADVYVALSQLRAAAKYAAACAGADDPDLPVAAAVAQVQGSVTAVHAAQECLQMHGGQGMTWENPSHLYLKRAKADSLALGRADQYRAWLGTLVGI